MRTQDQELFDRLSAHGIDPTEYFKIKRLVTLDFPQARFRFFKYFGGHTIDQVLRQIDQERMLLAKDFILPLEERIQFEKSISIAEMLAWDAILEMNSGKVGPWIMRGMPNPTETDEYGQAQYLYPSWKIVAVHTESGEIRQKVIPREELKDFSKRAKTWKRAYEQLGIWDLVYRGAVHKGVLSAREPQGWAVFTKAIIPRLYDYLLPHYEKRGHYSQQRDSLQAGKAQFPKELFEDMLLILRFEHPDFFVHASARQLKAVVQRYLKNKRESTESSKKPQTPQTVLSLPSTETSAL